MLSDMSICDRPGGLLPDYHGKLPLGLSSRYVLLILTIFGGGIYLFSLQAPWYLDDISNIVQNPNIHSLKSAFSQLFGARGLSYLTFSINYQIGSLTTTSYHVTNVLIHIASGYAVYLIFSRFYGSWMLPLAGALIFLVHPVQTQSVSYVVQRMTSLAGLFYFLSFYYYLKFRNIGICKEQGGDKHLYLSIVCAICCAYSKEIAVTIPIVLFFAESILGETQITFCNKYKYVTIYLIVIPVLIYAQLYKTLENFDQVSRMVYYLENDAGQLFYSYVNASDIRIKLLFTQFVVIWKYIFLLFFPYGQMLDYGYPVVASIANVRSLVAGSGIVIACIAAWRYRRAYPLISFGVFWFFAAISLESSILPLDCVFEHRLYVPSFGIVLGFVEGVRRIAAERIQPILFILIIVVLSWLTVQRNLLWSDPISFWKDNIEKAPHNHRPRAHLAKAFEEGGDLKSAIETQKEVAAMAPSTRNNLLLAMYYFKAGDYENAKSLYELLMAAEPGNSIYLLNYSIILGLMEEYRGSLDYAKRAAALAPNDLKVLTHLGTAYFMAGEHEQARLIWQRVLSVDPSNVEARSRLGWLNK